MTEKSFFPGIKGNFQGFVEVCCICANLRFLSSLVMAIKDSQREKEQNSLRRLSGSNTSVRCMTRKLIHVFKYFILIILLNFLPFLI